MLFSIPWLLSFIVGFLSLSEEILWVRIVGFTYEGLPPAFSFVLACYLVGIAAGAAFGRRVCAHVSNLYGAAAIALSVAALVDVSIPLISGRLIQPNSQHLYIPALAIVMTAGLKSVLFPIVHHLGSTPGDRLGRSMSRIYFGNIVGATLGPLVTGFVVLDYLNVDECFGAAAALSLLTAVICVLKSRRPLLILETLVVAILASVIAMKFIFPGSGSLIAVAKDASTVTHFVSNRYGLIHTARTDQGDMVFGGNVYDGIETVNVDTNPNRLDRLYILDTLRPNPKRILFVGLSGGAWVAVTARSLNDVESIDVVEINPGYLDLIHSYPQVSGILKDPRIHIHVDDGRRWLRRNPDARFDLIVQNTTYYWRANSANLLSREYFEEIRTHLVPGGIFAANTTGSFDVLATAQAVFPNSYLYSNFVYGSDYPLVPNPSRLLQIHRPDHKMFSFDQVKAGSVATELSHASLEPTQSFIARTHADAEVITDDNMLTEYRHGRRFGPEFLQRLLPPEIESFAH